MPWHDTYQTIAQVCRHNLDPWPQTDAPVKAECYDVNWPTSLKPFSAVPLWQATACRADCKMLTGHSKRLCLTNTALHGCDTLAPVSHHVIDTCRRCCQSLRGAGTGAFTDTPGALGAWCRHRHSTCLCGPCNLNRAGESLLASIPAGQGVQ